MVDEIEEIDEWLHWFKLIFPFAVRIAINNSNQMGKFVSRAVEKVIKRKLPFINIQWLKKNDSCTEISFVLLLWQFFQSQAELVCFLVIFLNLLLGHSILDLVIPFYCLIYGLLENIPLGHGFWTFNETYMIILVLLRYFAQLDVFCTNSLGNWLVSPSADCVPVSSSTILGYRKDRLIGLYQTQSQTTFISTVLPQFFVLVTISFVKRNLKCKGVWDFTVEDLPRSQNRVYFEKYYRHLRHGKKTVVWLLFQILPKTVCGYFYRLIPMTIRENWTSSQTRPELLFRVCIHSNHMHILFLFVLFTNDQQFQFNNFIEFKLLFWRNGSFCVHFGKTIFAYYFYYLIILKLLSDWNCCFGSSRFSF